MTHAIAHHLSIRLRSRSVLAPGPEARRLLARTVHRVAAPFPVLAFRGSDTHLHVLVLGDRPQAGRLCQRLKVALRQCLHLEGPFDSPWYEPVRSQEHLSSAFFYIFGQDRRHGFGSDPYHDASSLPDLLGMRCLHDPTFRRVREHLPRVRREDLLRALGVPELQPHRLEPGDPLAGFLGDAAAAAVGVAALQSSTAAETRARRAALEVAPTLRQAQVARLLGCHRVTLHRAQQAPADAALIRAIGLQLDLRRQHRVPRDGEGP